MTALANCRQKRYAFVPSFVGAAPLVIRLRAEYVRMHHRCDVRDYATKLSEAEIAAETQRTELSLTELAMRDDALRSSGR